MIAMDGFGEELAVGDVVVYPVRNGSHVHLVKAQVDEIGEAIEYGVSVPVLRVCRLQEASRRGATEVEMKTVKITALQNVTKVS